MSYLEMSAKRLVGESPVTAHAAANKYAKIENIYIHVSHNKSTQEGKKYFFVKWHQPVGT